MRILLAGYGYVAAELARRLLAAGHEPVAVRRSALEDLPFQVISGDLLDPSLLNALEAPIDAVVYSASPDESSDEAYARAYCTGLKVTLASLEQRGDPVQRVLVTTSTAVYQEQSGGWVDERSPTDRSGFRGRRLLEAEQLVSSARATGIALRLGGIYGPGRSGFLRRVAEGTTTMPTTPRYSNRIHRDDAARAIEHLLALPSPAAVYNGVDTHPADLRDVIRDCAEMLGLAPQAVEGAKSGSSSRASGHKRVSSKRLQDSGFSFLYPSYQEGYRAILQAEPLQRTPAPSS